MVKTPLVDYFPRDRKLTLDIGFVYFLFHCEKILGIVICPGSGSYNIHVFDDIELWIEQFQTKKILLKKNPLGTL